MAALAATSVFAQTTVTLDGYIDRGYLHTSNSGNILNYKGMTGSIAGTTTVGIKIDEQINPDLNARVWISTDWNELGGESQSSSANSIYNNTGYPAAKTANNITPGNLGTFANSQSYLQLASKTFGDIKMGSVNSATLTAVTSVGAPGFSTGVGSSYSTNFSVHDGYNTGTSGYAGLVNSKGNGSTGARAIRLGNTIVYTTPVIAGFQASIAAARLNNNGAPGVDATTAGATTVANNSYAVNGQKSAIDTVGMREGALRYTNGPLDVMYTRIRYYNTSQTETYGGLTVPNQTSTQQTLAANFAILPTLKIFGAKGSSYQVGTTQYNMIDSKFKQYGVALDVTPTTSLWVQAAKKDDQSVNDLDQTMRGLGANYLLSKRTRLYFRADRIVYNTNNPEGIGNKQSRAGLGLSHTF